MAVKLNGCYFAWLQVPAAFNDKRQHGVYAHAAIALLLGLGYQVRLGICDADAYGVPEVRSVTAARQRECWSKPGLGSGVFAAEDQTQEALPSCQEAARRLLRHVALTCLKLSRIGALLSAQAVDTRPTLLLLLLSQMMSLADLGCCCAAVLQARTRAIFLGALSGREQLPPLPAATHIRTKSSSCPKLAQGCCLGFACEVWMLPGCTYMCLYIAYWPADRETLLANPCQ